MKIALFQDESIPLDLKQNLTRLDEVAAQAHRRGADLLLTPELFLFGYAPARIRAEVTPEQVTRAQRGVEEIARRHSIALVVSLPGEEQPQHRGITAELISAEGVRVAHYQKVQLFGAEEKASFRPGEQPPPVVELGGIRLGMVVCYDIEFPEMARAAAAAGAELLLVPTALAGDVPAVPQLLIPSRALENRMTVAYANHCGTEDGLMFDGRSLVAGPEGQVLGSLDASPGLLVVEVGPRPNAGREGPWYLEDRRAGLHCQWLNQKEWG